MFFPIFWDGSYMLLPIIFRHQNEKPKSVASVRRPLTLALRWSVSCGLG